MNSITFVLALHNHQPVGNFDNVVEAAYQTSYRPFLDVLERHPSMKIALHNSGCLVDWLLDHRPEYFDQLGKLVERGQIELVTGGYYEPILPSIPEADREGQIRKLSEWIRERFDQDPKGLWLTERVWEPSLVGSVARAGVGYTMVDDSHFLAAGVDADRLWGHYLTEDQGVPLRVFPISKALRYLIPFQAPEESIALLRRLADEEPGRVALLGDDGEKFGVWPHTHQLVYEEGWLDRFFTLLEENRDWIQIRFPSEAIREHDPVGKVYLPTASYMEMMEWSLPAGEQTRYHDFLSHVEQNGGENAKFVRGGFWRNFFSRYDESDHINKRMLMLRERVDRLNGSPDADRALDLLWAAQCNCAYWHGVFGGLYLPHLRDALYQRILAAEGLIDRIERGPDPWIALDRDDFDCDGDREVFLRNPELTVVASPREGGSLQEISFKPLRASLTNGLTRRPEAYHAKVARAVLENAPRDDGAQSIHDLVLTKEANLERFLHYDAYRRASFIDHFLRDDTTLDAFHDGRHGEQGDFAAHPYEVASADVDGGKLLSLRRTGTVWREGEPYRVSVEKRLRLAPSGTRLEAAIILEVLEERPLTAWFANEWNFGLLGGDSPDHRYRIPGVPDAECALNSRGATSGVETLALFDRHRGFEVELDFAEPVDLWRLPVETVSLSEGGFERIYQSSTVLPRWRLVLEPGTPRRIEFAVEVRRL